MPWSCAMVDKRKKVLDFHPSQSSLAVDKSSRIASTSCSVQEVEELKMKEMTNRAKPFKQYQKADLVVSN